MFVPGEGSSWADGSADAVGFFWWKHLMDTTNSFTSEALKGLSNIPADLYLEGGSEHLESCKVPHRDNPGAPDRFIHASSSSAYLRWEQP